jgi:hypothetical protein
MPKRKFDPGFAPPIDLLRRGLLILSFESLFILLMSKTNDLSSLLRLCTGTVMRATVANLPVADQIFPLPVGLHGPRIAQPMPLRTPVAILLRVVSKVAFAEGSFLLTQGLPLRGNHHCDPLRINLLKLLRVRVPGIGTGHFTGLL